MRINGEPSPSDLPVARRAYRSRNKDAVRATARDYFARHRDAILAVNREWRARNKESRKEIDRVRRLTDRAKHLEKRMATERRCARERYAANLEANRLKARLHESNRRAQMRNGGGKFSYLEYCVMAQLCGNRCLKCGVLGITIDHILPLAMGGSNKWANIQPLCGKCNSSKYVHIIDYRGWAWPKSAIEALFPHRLAVERFIKRTELQASPGCAGLSR